MTCIKKKYEEDESNYNGIYNCPSCNEHNFCVDEECPDCSKQNNDDQEIE